MEISFLTAVLLQCHPCLMALSGKTINNRYRLYEKIRANEHLESFCARDLNTGDDALFTVYNEPAISRTSEDIFRYKLDTKKVLGQTHPCCASPRDAGTLYEHCFQVTSWYEGPTLTEKLYANTTFTYQQLLVFAHNIASALAHLHNCGIRHLGLDPSHIILHDNGALIIDIGISHLKQFDTKESLILRVNTISPEETGLLSITPDRRSDLFSLGALLFRMCTGRFPFDGPRITAMLHTIITKTPDSALLHHAGIPQAFADLIMRLLAKELDERYQSAEEVCEHLEALISGNVPLKEPSHFRQSRTSSFPDDVAENDLALYAHNKAKSMLKNIIALSSSKDGGMEDAALREIAHIHLIAGNYDETLRICHDILTRTTDTHQRAEIIALQSAAHFRRNEWQQCIDNAIEGLRLLGETFPKKGWYLWLRCIGESIPFLIGFIIPAVLQQKKKNIVLYKSILSIYQTMIEAFLFRNMGPEFLLASVRMNIIARWHIGQSKELAISIIGIALICSALGFFSIAEKLLKRALDISIKANDRWGQAYALGFLGLVSEFSGNYQKGIEHYYPASMAIFSEIGDIKNIGIIHIGLVQSYLHLSEYEKALLHNEQSHRIALAMGDSFFVGMSLVYYARIYREKGECEKAKNYANEAIAYNRQKDLSQNLCAALIELGCLYLETEESSKAIACFEEARKLEKEGYFSGQHVLHLYGHLAEAYCKAHVDVREKSFQRDIRKALRASTAGLRKTRKWTSLRAKALRSRACVHAAQGNIAKAEQYFKRSIMHARILGGRFDEARGLLEYALLLLQTGKTAQSRERLEQAYELFSTIGSNGYRELCGRLLGIKTNSKRPIDASIQQIRQQVLQDAQISLATGMGDAAKLAAMMDSIYEYFGAEEGFIFSLEDEKLIPIFVYPSSLADISHLKSAAVQYLQSRKDASLIHSVFFQSVPKHHHPGNQYRYLPLGNDENPIGICALRLKPTLSLPNEDIPILKDIIAHALALFTSAKAKHETNTEKRAELTDATRRKLNEAIAFINEQYCADISREGLAARVDLSPNYFSKLFFEYTGKKLHEYINSLRIQKATEMLVSSDEKIIEIAYAVGFENLRTFNRAFKDMVGTTPYEYRKKHKKTFKNHLD